MTFNWKRKYSMPFYVHHFLILFLLVMVSVPASAKDDPGSVETLEQLMNTEVTTVIGACKYRQELTDAPASVSIVTSDDIRKGGFRNLAEIINSLGGFYFTYIRSFYNVGVRGFSPLGDFNSRVLLLVDGFRLNDGLYESAPLGTDFPVDIDLIDRIEVIRGPGSSLYGTNAFLAVMNVITRNGKDIRGMELSASAGSYNSRTGRVTGGGKPANNIDLLFSGTYHDTKGQQELHFPEYAATNNGIARNLDGETFWDLMAKVVWKDFSLLLLNGTREKDVPTAPYGTVFNDPDEKIRDDHTLVGLNYNRFGTWGDLTLRLTYNRYGAKSDYPLLENTAVRTVNRDDNLGEWFGTDLFLSKNISDHLLTAGIEYRWQFNQRMHNYDVGYEGAGTEVNHRSFVQGYYLQDEYHIRKELILYAGLRADHYENFGATYNPRAALIWKPRTATVLRLSYGEAFRAPNAYEKYYSDGVFQKGNPDLQPERARTAELGWDQFIGENIHTAVVGYHTHISELIEQITDTDGLLVFTNQSKVQSSGMELLAEGKWENGAGVRLAYGYQDTTNIGSDQPVANSPKNQFRGSLTAPLPLKKTFATLEANYDSSRINANGEKIGGAAVFNLTLLNRDLLKGLDLSASVYNLFDKNHAAPSGPEHINYLGESLREIPQDGTTFRIKATYRF